MDMDMDMVNEEILFVISFYKVTFVGCWLLVVGCWLMVVGLLEDASIHLRSAFSVLAMT